MSIALAGEIVKEVGTGQIDRVEGTGGSLVVLIAMLILFGAAAYFTGRLYGKVGMYTCIAGFAIVAFTLYAVGGLRF
jgi:cation transporter-like permease